MSGYRAEDADVVGTVLGSDGYYLRTALLQFFENSEKPI
jgi:hypothetical protein